jgi:hypothetical protein
MKTGHLLLLTLIFMPLIVYCQTSVNGYVSGKWLKSQSPFNVIGDIKIPKGERLEIESGVAILFQGHYSFTVDSLAILMAIGTEDDTIVFMPKDTIIGWNGLRFFYADSTSILKYCKIAFAKKDHSDQQLPSDPYEPWERNGAGIFCYYSNLLICYCTISNNYLAGPALQYIGGGIGCYHSNPIIYKNTISHNVTNGKYCDGAGIGCAENSSPRVLDNIITYNNASTYFCSGGGIDCIGGRPIIQNNFISFNKANSDGGGINLEFHADALIQNNIISYNSSPYGSAISCSWYTRPNIINNTLINNDIWDWVNGSGIYITLDCHPIMANTILWNKGEKEIIIGNDYFSSDIQISNCDLQQGWAGNGNISSAPLFMGGDSTSYHFYELTDNSPCIDAGSVDTAGLFLPLTDFAGNPRIVDGDNNGTKVIDMGALEKNVSATIINDDILTIPLEYKLHQNYPNPFNQRTTINYSIPQTSLVNIAIFDIQGIEIRKLINEEKLPGNYTVNFDGSNLSNGIYFYRLQTGNFAQTKKLLLMK